MIKALGRVINKLRSAAEPGAVKANRPVLECLEERKYFSKSPIPLPRGIKVLNLFDTDGNPMNQSVITLPFDKTIRIADANQIQLRGYVVNPLNGHQKKVVIHVLNLQRGGDFSSLIITTDRLMEKRGGKILFGAGALTDKNGEFLPAQTVVSLKGQNKERFTLANRAFRPTDVNFFTQDLYSGATASIDVSSPVPEATVTANLTAFLDKKVAAGIITQGDEDLALQLYNNPQTIAIIPDANLRAALVSLKGTIAEQGIDAMLSGANATGVKWSHVTFDPNVVTTAEVAQTTLNHLGRLQTMFRTQFAGEPFQALSAVVAHEVLRQDGPDHDGQQEDIIVNAVQTYVWAQQLLVDPSVASVRTDLVRMNNDRLFAMLNSGKFVFPRVGIENAPLLDPAGGIFPGADPQTGGVFTSFEDYMRRTYQNIGIGNANTPGNVSWTADYQAITNTNIVHTFAQSALNDLDKKQVVNTDKLAITLAGILRLTV